METINFKLHKSKIQPFLELFQSVKNCNPGRQKKPPAGGQLSSKAAPPPERQLLIVWETCSKFSGPFLNKAAPYRTVLKKKKKKKEKMSFLAVYYLKYLNIQTKFQKCQFQLLNKQRNKAGECTHMIAFIPFHQKLHLTLMNP